MTTRTLHTAMYLCGLATLFVLAPASARADQIVIWNNYPAPIENALVNMSSERNTQIIESTWAVDDVDVTQITGIDPAGVRLTRIDWIGTRNPDFDYAAADVIILDNAFGTITEMYDLAFTATDLDPDPNPWPISQTYEGSVTLATPIDLLALGDHFYIGVRLVGASYMQGRNQINTSSNTDTLRGRTGGYVKSAIFGAPTWTPAAVAWLGDSSATETFEFAYRLQGVPFCRGDFNDDGQINLADLNILLAAYGTTSDATHPTGDMNADGAINLSDLQALLLVYGNSCD